MESMLDLIAGIERMMYKFLPDTVFIQETMKLFEAMQVESNSQLKQDSYDDIVSYIDYVQNILENFGNNITKIILTNHNLYVKSEWMQMNAIKLYVELNTTVAQANEYLLAVNISQNLLNHLKQQLKKVILFQEVIWNTQIFVNGFGSYNYRAYKKSKLDLQEPENSQFVVQDKSFKLITPLLKFNIIESYTTDKLQVQQLSEPIILNITSYQTEKYIDLEKVFAVYWDPVYETWSAEGVKLKETIVLENKLINFIFEAYHCSDFAIIELEYIKKHEGVNPALIWCIVFVGIATGIILLYIGLNKKIKTLQIKVYFLNLSVNYFFSAIIIDSFEKALQKTLIYLSYCASMAFFLALFISSKNLYNNHWNQFFWFFTLFIPWCTKYFFGFLKFFVQYHGEAGESLFRIIIYAFIPACAAYSYYFVHDIDVDQNKWYHYFMLLSWIGDQVLDIMIAFLSFYLRLSKYQKLWKFLKFGGFAENAFDSISVEEYKTIVAKKNEKLAKEYEESKKKNLKEISNEEPLDDSSGFVF